MAKVPKVKHYLYGRSLEEEEECGVIQRILVSTAKKDSLNSASKDRESEINENEIRTKEASKK